MDRTLLADRNEDQRRLERDPRERVDGRAPTVVNLDPYEAVEISVGDRIAQLVIVAVPETAPSFVEELPESSRGAGGFGSTGIS